MTTIILPVSRPDYLNEVFHCLEMLEAPSDTNLLTIVDGDANLYIETRNKTQESKYNQRLTIQFPSKTKGRNFDIRTRRKRIADIHNEIRMHLWESDYIFGIEDDTLFPTYALKRLTETYSLFPQAGLVQGVELGRWGVAMVGAWKADDVYEPTVFSSLMPFEEVMQPIPKKLVEEIDAGGLYCFLTKGEHYLKHEFKPYKSILGPDVDFGMSLRQQGYQNYLDWSIRCTHKSKQGNLSIPSTKPVKLSLIKGENRWNQHIEKWL